LEIKTIASQNIGTLDQMMTS